VLSSGVFDNGLDDWLSVPLNPVHCSSSLKPLFQKVIVLKSSEKHMFHMSHFTIFLYTKFLY